MRPRCPHHTRPEVDCVQCRTVMRMRACICGEWSLGAHCNYCGKPIGEARRESGIDDAAQLGLFGTMGANK